VLFCFRILRRLTDRLDSATIRRGSVARGLLRSCLEVFLLLKLGGPSLRALQGWAFSEHSLAETTEPQGFFSP
jgi:hypothetical protein